MSDYTKGYDDGRRRTQQEALVTVAALVTMLGGEVRIPEHMLVGQNPLIERFDDPNTREVVLKVL